MKYVTRDGVEKGGVVKQILPDGRVQVQIDGGGLTPVLPEDLTQACERYRLKKIAEFKKWVRIA